MEIRHGENARAKNCGCPGDQAGRQVSRPVKTKQDSLAYRAMGKMSTAADRWTDTLHRSSVPSLWPKCAAIRRDSRLIGEVVTEHSRMVLVKAAIGGTHVAGVGDNSSWRPDMGRSDPKLKHFTYTQLFAPIKPIR